MLALSNRSFATTVKDKAAQRDPERLKGLTLTKQQVEEAMKAHYDEEGSYSPPHASTFPSIDRRACLMNLRIPPLGIAPPPFGDEQVKEIEQKTTLRRDNLQWDREHWTDDSLQPDEKSVDVIIDDIQEMYKKGVSFATINLFIDWFSGADKGYKHAIYNKTWARIE
ncbi:hypothetical protein RFI_06961 [Reticulomyxa filosa]|uniref:Uncharacterized protein n=1 Tax=Reticulomyxa filosa TaxID=46433 RepID=X6NWF2_RETFI|nr:hypothetical protein RFI_06961 [Reticulomyxa filosa]|eukprot:ETO30159.1 hypothetical protein RFI_06961 [Reticulomyxa filosa]